MLSVWEKGRSVLVVTFIYMSVIKHKILMKGCESDMLKQMGNYIRMRKSYLKDSATIATRNNSLTPSRSESVSEVAVVKLCSSSRSSNWLGRIGLATCDSSTADDGSCSLKEQDTRCLIQGVHRGLCSSHSWVVSMALHYITGFSLLSSAWLSLAQT